MELDHAGPLTPWRGNTMPDYNLDKLLTEICAELDLDPEKHKQIEKAYKDISSFLAEDGFFKDVENQIYPQGSVLIGTINLPISNNAS